MIAGLSKTFLATLPPKVGLNRSQSTRSAFRKARLGWKLLLTYLQGRKCMCAMHQGTSSGLAFTLTDARQVLLTTSPIVCSAVNATVAFILVALVRITHVYLAPGALRLCVVVWIFHPVFQLPLLQGFFLLFCIWCKFFFWAFYTLFLYRTYVCTYAFLTTARKMK